MSLHSEHANYPVHYLLSDVMCKVFDCTFLTRDTRCLELGAETLSRRQSLPSRTLPTSFPRLIILKGTKQFHSSPFRQHDIPYRPNQSVLSVTIANTAGIAGWRQ